MNSIDEPHRQREHRPVIRYSEVPRHIDGDTTVVPLVTAANGGTSFLNGITKFPPGASIAPRQYNTLESVTIIRGEAIVEIEGNSTRLSTYDTTLIPANSPHRFQNASDTEEMWILWTYGSIQAIASNIETRGTSRVDVEDELASSPLSETTVHEIAEIEVIPGHEADFEAAVAAAVPHFQSAPGARTLTLVRSVEFPTRYRLVVGWDTVDDHVVAFRGSPGFAEWRRLAGPHFAAPPRVEHVRNVLTAF